MMRITAGEKGIRFDSTWRQDYVEIYTQPLHNYLIAWFYHNIWETLTWRLFRYLGWDQETFKDKDGNEFDINIAQDLRCYDLTQKNRIVVSREFGEKIYGDTSSPESWRV